MHVQFLNMILDAFLIFSSVLFGLSLSKIFSAFIVNKIGYVMFSTDELIDIPNFTVDLASKKSQDLIEYGLFILISISVFLVLSRLYKNRKYDNQHQILIGIVFLLFSSCTLLTTFFSGYSGTNTILFVTIYSVFLVYISTILVKKKVDAEVRRLSIYNGVVVAFYLSVLLQNFVASIVIPLVLLTTLPIVFYLLVNRYRQLGHPGLIILSVSFLFPYNKSLLLILGVVSTVLVVYKNQLRSNQFTNLLKWVYPFVLLFLFLYDPVFYVGTFDSIEEGIWAGWLYRVVNNQVPYRDFAIYHPPLLLWGLNLFTSLFGESLFSIRLYFHLLQVFSLMFIYVFLKRLIKRGWIRLLIFVLIVSYGSTVVRNNLEVRLVAGMLPLLFIDFFQQDRKLSYLLIAGVFTGAALFVSTEVGLASILSVLFVTALIKIRSGRWKNVITVLFGVSLMFLLMMVILLISGSLSGFVENITYYTSIFSKGYMNSPLPQPRSAALIDWLHVDSYIGSTGFMWNLFEVGIMATVLSLISQYNRRSLRGNKHLALLAGLSIYSVVLGRSALGRSDFYHISFVVVLAMILIGYLLDKVVNFSNETAVFVLCLLIFLIGRGTVSNLVKEKLIAVQAYSNPAGTYPKYRTDKIGLLADPGTNVDTLDQMIHFIESSTSEGDRIFAFPWSPEIYFLTNRANATSFDTPLSYVTRHYQNKMIEELIENNPKYVVYNPNFAVGGLSRDVLKEVDDYILNNYYSVAEYEKFSILAPHPSKK